MTMVMVIAKLTSMILMVAVMKMVVMTIMNA